MEWTEKVTQDFEPYDLPAVGAITRCKCVVDKWERKRIIML